ncbi:hypothetical protein AVEN_38860-1 [Araneus ventricosus]|uniref:Uncharacterized protein n=1 Tax=Araneus ventricosus TaxID=182803 RepID=A0A4Y2A0R5_ARAVE|nr:hypothetical protein AVEN_38860-1 [Araneus ventricosus]
MRLAVPLSAKHRKGTRVVSEEYDLQITRSLISQSCFLNSTEMEEMDEEDACFVRRFRRRLQEQIFRTSIRDAAEFGRIRGRDYKI